MIFRLNESTMVLEFVAESFSGVGQMEVLQILAEPGLYFIAVASFAGAGFFEITAYISTADVHNGANGTLNSATDVGANNFTATGVIDNPYDIDFFRFQLTRNSEATFTIQLSHVYELILVLNGTNWFIIDSGITYELPEGTHFIAVRSRNGFYNPNPSFQYTLRLVSALMGPPGTLLYLTTPHNDLHLHMSPDWTRAYVNGTRVRFNFHSRVINHPFSTTTQIITPTSNQFIPWLYQHQQAAGTRMPMFANFWTDWEYSGQPSFPSLILGVANTHINVHRTGQNPITYTRNHTDLVINVNTGEVIDFTRWNFWYEIGNRRFSISPARTYAHRCMITNDRLPQPIRVA